MAQNLWKYHVSICAKKKLLYFQHEKTTVEKQKLRPFLVQQFFGSVYFVVNGKITFRSILS